MNISMSARPQNWSPDLHKSRCVMVIAMLLMSGSVGSAQGTRADYERANNLPKLFANKVFKARLTPHWFARGTKFWYRNDLKDGAREYVVVDASQGTRKLAFDHKKIGQALSTAANREFKATHLPLEKLVFSDNIDAVWFRAGGNDWRCDLQTYDLIKEMRPLIKSWIDNRNKWTKWNRPNFSGRRGEVSPNRKWKIIVRNHNLHLQSIDTRNESALTTDGTEDDSYSKRVFWSPDSTKIVAYKTQQGEEHLVYYVESSPKVQVQPKLHSRRYHKPGDKLPITKPHLFDVKLGKEISISDTLFPSPWSLRQVRWDSNSSRFTFHYNQRGHQVVRVIAIDGVTGQATTIVDERAKTFIDYVYKQFLYFADKTNEIIWASERDGWNHLYLYDSRDGTVKNQITRGKWVMRGVERIDEKKRQIWFRASGIYTEQDPYYVHFCRVNFDGTESTVLTEGNGTHEINYSPDGSFFIDKCSRADMPPVHELRRSSDGKLVCELDRGDVSELLKTGWQAPERFVAKARDGTTDIHGLIYRPTNFDPGKKYPIIEMIYAGPHGSFVPKSFRRYSSVQSMAELGFILVRIDGMGTSNRSKAFHDVCWKNLGDSGFPDRILWIKAAAKKYSYMDLTRVGIYGGSAGGQSSTRALLAFGDFYKVAVSDCGCHDNRMDKVWWNEQWMGWPIGPHYSEQSNVTNAHKLRGKLFLTVAELDYNVDPTSTMQVVDALIKADKDFDLLVVPGAGHGVGESRYGKRRRRDFFVRHLLNVEPRIHD